MAGIWDEYIGAPAPQETDKPWYNDAYEVGRQIVGGAVVDLPRMVGQGARWLAEDGTAMDDWGREVTDAADARAPAWEPDMQGRGGLASTLIKGGRAVGPMLPAIAASMLPGGQFAGPAVAAGVFGPSSAQDTEDKLRQQGVADEDATRAGWVSGTIQGVGDAAATALGLRAFKAAQPLWAGTKTTADVAARLTDKAILKPLAKGLALNMVTQPLTEVGQDLGTEYTERAFGAEPEDAWEIAKDSAQGGLGLTLLLGPFAAGAHVRRARGAAELEAALNHPSPAIRQQAQAAVQQYALREGVARDDVQAWGDERTAAANRELFTPAGTPLQLGYTPSAPTDDTIHVFPDGSAALPGELAEARSRQAGARHPSFVPGQATDSTAEVAEQVVQRQAQAHQEMQAQQAAAAQDPRVLRLEAIRQRAAETAQALQEQQQRAAEFGITLPKAVEAYAELERAHTDGLLSDEQFAEGAGMLAGQAPGLGAVRKELAALRRYVEQKAAQDERIEQAEAAQRAADIARLQQVQANPIPAPTENPVQVPQAGDTRAAQTPETAPAGATQPQAGGQAPVGRAAEAAGDTAPARAGGVQTAGVAQTPIAGIDANRTVEVGRAGRKRALTPLQLLDKLYNASEVNKRRVLDALGAEMTEDPTTGLPRLVFTDNPRTLDEVAALEAERTGRKVTRQAISQSLAEFGVDEGVIDRVVAQNPDGISAAELGLGQAAEGSGVDAGVRTEDTLSKAAGQGVVEGSETARQRALRLEADRLLKEAGIDPDEYVGDGPPITPDNATVRDLRDDNPALVEANTRALLAHPEANNAQADWDVPGVEWADLPDSIKADAVEAYVLNLKRNDGDLNFQEWTHETEDIYETYKQWQANNARGPGRLEGRQGRVQPQPQADRARLEGPARGQEAGAQDAGPADGSGAGVGAAAPVVGDGSKSAATVTTKKKRRVAVPAEGARTLRTPGRTYDVRDGGGNLVRVVETTIEDLSRDHPGIAHAVQSLRKEGLGHVVDAVESWGVATGNVAWDGVFTVHDGKRTVLLAAHSLNDANFTTLHELGHVADLLEFHKGGVFSGRSELGLRVLPSGKIQAHGDVAWELLDHYENGDDAVSDLLTYPLDRAAYPEFDADGLRQELFAQAMAAYMTPLGRKIITDQLPETAMFLEDVLNEIRSPAYQRKAAATAPNAGGRTAGPAQQPAPARVHPVQRRVHGARDAQGAAQRRVAQTQTPAFKRWFGDSKVVGADGNPLVVYHGTSADVEFFDPLLLGANTDVESARGGFFFAASPKVASGYAILSETRPGLRSKMLESAAQSDILPPELKQMLLDAASEFSAQDLADGMPIDVGPGRAMTPGANVLPVYLSIENPLVVEFGGAEYREHSFADLVADARAAGHDGAIFRNAEDSMHRDFAEPTDIFVVFRPEQIKSAIGNNGQFDPKNRNIRYSRSSASTRAATRALMGPPGAQQIERRVRGVLAALKDSANWAVHRGAFTEDLAAMAAKVLPSARGYINQVRAVAVVRQRAEREVDAIVQEFAALSARERGTGAGSVNAFLKASTMAREWGYDPGIRGAKFDKNSDLARQFNALSREGQAVVRRVFQHGRETLEQMRTEIEKTARAEYAEMIRVAERGGDRAEADKLKKKLESQLARVNTLLGAKDNWPYAPLKRFGNHVVVGMSQEYLDADRAGDTATLERLESDPNHYFVAFRESKREARALADTLAGRFAYHDHFQRDDAQQQLMGGRDALGAFRRLRGLVEDTQDDRLQGKARQALNTLMADLHLSLLSEHSVRQSERTRAGVAGAEDDMMRAFATHGRAQAHFIASLKSQGAVHDALLAMKAEADARIPGRAERREFYNELLRRHVMGMDYSPSPVVEKLMGASSVWMLLTSPAHFLVNATQPWMMTLPTMAGKHGFARAAGHLSRAYSDIFPLVKDGTITQDEYGKLPDDVKMAVEILANRGRIDISLSQDLGRWRSEGGNSPDALLGKAVTKLRGVAQTVESINRITSAIAAVRMEVERGASFNDAVDYADKLIYDTHGDYSGFNAPRVMRNPVGRLATQFRKFQLIQLSLFARLTNQAFRGASAQERAVAQRALAFNLSTMFAVGGLLGMPGAQAVGLVLSMAFGDKDEPWDDEAKLRQLVGGGAVADLLTKGIPKTFGLDVSGRIGAGGMLSLLPYTDLEPTRKGYESAVTAALGPFIGGILPNMVDGVGLIGQGQYWQGLEKFLPKGFADASKAVRYQTDGFTNRRGEVLMSAEDMAFLASVGQAIGLPTTTLTDRSARAGVVFKSDKHFTERSGTLKREYTQAYRANDAAAMREAREAWMTLQEARARHGYPRQPLSQLLRAPRDQDKSLKHVVEGVKYTRSNVGLAGAW